MKIISKFDFNLLSEEDKKVLYKKERPLASANKTKIDVELYIPKGNCIWIDSAVCCLKNEKYIALENKEFQSAVEADRDKYKIHFSMSPTSALTLSVLNRRYNPTSVVFYFSPQCKYLTVEELNQLLQRVKKNMPGAIIILAIDLRFILYHRIKYTNDDVVSRLNCKKIIKFGIFEYLLEI
jgi:hypothetical protein